MDENESPAESAPAATGSTGDEESITPVPPFGAVVVVYRRTGLAVEFLVLHRAYLGAAYAGDWAWGPPSGSRHPDEEPVHCAHRELREETGLQLELRPVSAAPPAWSVFLADATGEPELRLSPEHDRFAWLPLAQAAAIVTPETVRTQLLIAARDIGEFEDESVVQSEADVMSGTPVFVGTRVPIDNLIDSMQGGDSLDDFLDQFPSVRREQAIAALEVAREALWARAGRARPPR